MLVIQAKDQYP